MGTKWWRVAVILALVASTLYVLPAAPPARGAARDIETAVGGPGEGQATNLGQVPAGVALRRDPAGKLTIYVADTYHDVVRALDTDTGQATVVAGGGPSFGDDGPARSAQLDAPGGVAADAAGNLYIADTGNHRVRKVDPSGKITTLAGNGIGAYGGDCDATVTSCPATLASLNSPTGVAVDGAGVVFIADTASHRARKVDSSGKITTLAGNGTAGSIGDAGLATLAQLSSPRGVAADGAGNVFIADTGNNRVRKVDSSGRISTAAGGSVLPEDGTAATSQLSAPRGVWAGAGQLLIADTGSHRIRRVDSSGTITTLAGDGTSGFSGDTGPASSARLSSPQGVAQDGGTIVVVDTGNRRTRTLTSGTMSTVGGNGTESFGGDGGPARFAQIRRPGGMAFAADGSMVFIDTGNQRVRKVDARGIISTVAGTGATGFSGDGGAATAAQFHFGNHNVGDVAVDEGGAVFITDQLNFRVRKVDAAGVINTVAGNGTRGFSGDGGPATSAQLVFVSGLHVTQAGELLIADSESKRIRAVSSSGTIRTFAGGGTAAPNSCDQCPAPGDGGPATDALLGRADDVAGDQTGNIYIAESRRIRKIDTSGTITSLAGSGAAGDNGDGGPAIEASLEAAGVSVDAGGNAFIATLNRVRKVDAAGIINGFAGQVDFDSAGFSGDGGPASAARLQRPQRVALGADGSLFIADTENDRIRTVSGAGVTRPSTDVLDPALDLARLQPTVGPERGGTHVTITGSGFERATGVKFGDAPASSFMVESGTRIHAAAPPGHGTAEVSVLSASGSSLKKMTFTYVAPTGNWGPSGSLLSPSSGHTATVLSGPACEASVPRVCGRVLVVGGTPSSFAAVARVELYDPETGNWNACGPDAANATCPAPLGTSRTGHTATLLGDGRVLVVGGSPGSFALGDPQYPSQFTTPRSAELFEPTTGRWHSAGVLNGFRSGHTATLLGNGQVLVTGGGDASSEIFDPKTEKWSPVGSMSTRRSGHTATLLDNGQVLVAGGDGSNTAEIFDPVGRSWRRTGSLASAHSGHTATRLPNGKVLVVGARFGAPLAEIFDVKEDNGVGRWAPAAGSGIARRFEHTATLLASGKVLLAGGCCDPASMVNENPVDSVEIFDPSTGRFALTSALKAPRRSAAAVLLSNGKVLVSGGQGEDGKGLESVELFEESVRPQSPVVAKVDRPTGPTLNGVPVTISGAGFLPVKAVHFGVAAATLLFVSDSYLVVVPPAQGQGTLPVTVTSDTGRSPATPAAKFTYGAGAWSATEGLRSCSAESEGSCVPRQHHTATTLRDGTVLVAGGTKNMQPDGAFIWATTPVREQLPKSEGLGFIQKTSQLYNPATGKWRAATPMNEARFQHSATLLRDGRILVVGGQDAFMKAIKTAELFDPETRKWTFTEPMNSQHGRFSHTATLLKNGMVLVVGGSDNEDGRLALASVELFDPRTNQWHQTEPLRSPRQYHTATALDDGRVVVHGGLGADCSGPGSAQCVTAAPAAAEALRSGDLTVLSSTEIFDLDANGGAGKWSPSAPSSVARFHHSATLLTGRRCGDSCGKILVAGGNSAAGALSSAELFDPVAGSWTPTPSLKTPRAGHSATLLPDGTVLVAGSGPPFHNSGGPYATTAAEVYDPSSREGWTNTDWMSSVRGVHSATLLDTEPCGTRCGKVLVVGGAGAEFFAEDPDAIESAELYTPAPRVATLEPATARARGGERITIDGDHFRGVLAVTFGITPGQSITVDSPNSITAVVPAHAKGPVQVAVVNEGGTSATIEPDPRARFVFTGLSGQVDDLLAKATSESAVDLSFASPDDGTTLAPATSYLVKQSKAPIDEANFDAALTLCGQTCTVRPSERVVLSVTDLEPQTTYYFAVRAVGADGDLGPQSVTVSATTLAGSSTTTSCRPRDSSSAPNELVYAAGRYHLIGLPDGTLVAPESGLFGWFNLGAGGSYSSLNGPQRVEGGRGYWAWFRCDTAVSLSGAGADSARFSLGGYRASIVGNPSGTASSAVTGHDFAALWNPALNGGAGGYHVSGYREAQPLAVGEALWVFSYADTTVNIAAR